MDQQADRPPNASGPPPSRRRPRYPGKSPRRFEHRYKELHAEAYPGIREHIRARGRTPAGTHLPVLVGEVMRLLRPAPGEVVADCTVGYGGHAAEFLRRIGPAGVLIGLDVDGAELECTGARLRSFGRAVRLHRSNYAGLPKALAAEGLQAADIIFADLGVSSMQVDDPARGFSYKHPDAPLDMRMDGRLPATAADLLRMLGRDELSRALRELGDEPDSDRIADWIVRQRQVAPITRTGELTRLIFHAKGTTEKAWRKRAEFSGLHPAARTFQALRIVVNDELGALRQLLRVAPSCLRPGGRIGIISFHSGEDRLVKNAFRDGFRSGVYSAYSGQVIRPTPKEIGANPRSSSAKFRWAAVPPPGGVSPNGEEA